LKIVRNDSEANIFIRSPQQKTVCRFWTRCGFESAVASHTPEVHGWIHKGTLPSFRRDWGTRERWTMVKRTDVLLCFIAVRKHVVNGAVSCGH